MERICEEISKWAPKVSEEDKEMLLNIVMGRSNLFGGKLGKKLLETYIKLLQPYKDILKKSLLSIDNCAASGLMFFYGSLVYIMHYSNWGKHIDDILLYNLLYMMVDTYIDNNKIDENVKKIAIKQMEELLHNQNKTFELVDPVLGSIAQVYSLLITRCPEAKKDLILLFYDEIEGLKIQNNSKLDRKEYYDIALKKGGQTMVVLQCIMNNNDEDIKKATYELGSIMQLLDDSLDVMSDIKGKINTIATYDLYWNNNLDDLWLEIAERIVNIDPQFTLYKIIYTIFALYIPGKLPYSYTNKLVNLTNKFNIFYDHKAGMSFANNVSSTLNKAVISSLNVQ